MKFYLLLLIFLLGGAWFLFNVLENTLQNAPLQDGVEITLGLKHAESTSHPEDTLVAPFAEQHVQPVTTLEEKASQQLPVNSVPMNSPHRSSQFVREWVTEQVSYALILDKEKISNLNTDIAPLFSESAFKEYKDFGQRTNIFTSVFHTANMHLESYLPEQPLLIVSESLNGTYQWTFETLVTLDLVKGDRKQYKTSSTGQSQKNIYLCITAIRKNTANKDGLLIGEWRTGKCKQNAMGLK